MALPKTGFRPSINGENTRKAVGCCPMGSLANLYRQAATIAAKILEGAKPSDLPVEQPTKFELVVNTRTAASLGIVVLQDLLLRSDVVID